jgi:hypothetical protein
MIVMTEDGLKEELKKLLKSIGEYDQLTWKRCEEYLNQLPQ